MGAALGGVAAQGAGGARNTPQNNTQMNKGDTTNTLVNPPQNGDQKTNENKDQPNNNTQKQSNPSDGQQQGQKKSTGWKPPISTENPSIVAERFKHLLNQYGPVESKERVVEEIKKMMIREPPSQKSKIATYIAIALVIFGIGGAAFYYVNKKKKSSGNNVDGNEDEQDNDEEERIRYRRRRDTSNKKTADLNEEDVANNNENIDRSKLSKTERKMLEEKEERRRLRQERRDLEEKEERKRLRREADEKAERRRIRQEKATKQQEEEIREDPVRKVKKTKDLTNKESPNIDKIQKDSKGASIAEEPAPVVGEGVVEKEKKKKKKKEKIEE